MEKTEQPTAKRLQEARKKGLVARSRDLTTSVLLLTSIGCLALFAPIVYSLLEELFKAVFTHLHANVTIESSSYWFREGVIHICYLLSPLFLTLFVVAILSNLGQVGFLLSIEAIKPKWQKINPFNIDNYKRVFNSASFVRVFFAILKWICVSVVFYSVLLFGLNELLGLGKRPILQIYQFVGKEGSFLGLWIAVLFVGLAVFDVLFQRWKFTNGMRMTKQEIKEERKESQRSSQQKAKRDTVLVSLATGGKQADILIVEEDRAIALKYQSDKMHAPICVEKGMKKRAEAMEQLAKKHQIPIVRNGKLIELLYESIDVGSPIPKAFYHDVASVLAKIKIVPDTKKK
jgi:flagellar biosynthetic protein FlhB